MQNFSVTDKYNFEWLNHQGGGKFTSQYGQVVLNMNPTFEELDMGNLVQIHHLHYGKWWLGRVGTKNIYNGKDSIGFLHNLYINSKDQKWSNDVDTNNPVENGNIHLIQNGKEHTA